MDEKVDTLDEETGMNQFGTYLRQKRGTTSLAQMSARCGLDRGYLSKIERGLRKPKMEALRCIADGYGVDLPTLFVIRANDEAVEKTRTEEVSPSPAGETRNGEMVALLEGIKRLKPDEQAELLMFCKRLFPGAFC